MNRPLTVRLLALLGAAALALAGCSTSGSPGAAHASQLQDHAGSGKYAGITVDPPLPRPAFTLTDTQGRPFSFGTVTAGHPTLLYFGYTHCPDVCPTTMADVSAALAKVPASVAEQTYVVFVSTDVRRDTGPVIATWLANFSAGSKAHWVGLRGTQTEVDTAQAAAHIFLAEDGGATHSSQVPLYSPDNYEHVQFTESTTEQQQMQHDIAAVATS